VLRFVPRNRGETVDNLANLSTACARHATTSRVRQPSVPRYTVDSHRGHPVRDRFVKLSPRRTNVRNIGHVERTARLCAHSQPTSFGSKRRYPNCRNAQTARTRRFLASDAAALIIPATPRLTRRLRHEEHQPGTSRLVLLRLSPPVLNTGYLDRLQTCFQKPPRPYGES
jgi:hypothetical protein